MLLCDTAQYGQQSSVLFFDSAQYKKHSPVLLCDSAQYEKHSPVLLCDSAQYGQHSSVLLCDTRSAQYGQNSSVLLFDSAQYVQHRYVLFLIVLSTYIIQSALLYWSAEMEQDRSSLLFHLIDCETTQCSYWTMPTVQQSMLKVKDNVLPLLASLAY